MKRSGLVIASIAAALMLGSATIASASTALPQDETVTLNPGHHGDGNAPENHGRAGDPGPPDGEQGKPAFVGGPPELPANASDRAREAVALAHERQQEIRERVAQIHAMEPGSGKGQAVSELMQQFGKLFRLSAAAAGGEDV